MNETMEVARAAYVWGSSKAAEAAQWVSAQAKAVGSNKAA